MVNSKWPRVKERLSEVEKWARAGLSDKQIARNLGICRSTLDFYKRTHPDFLDTIKRGREPFLAEIEKALVRRALGFTYEESRKTIKETDDRVTSYVEKTEQYLPPSVGACMRLLKNKDRGNWSNNPMKDDLDRERMELEIEKQRKKKF